MFFKKKRHLTSADALGRIICDCLKGEDGLKDIYDLFEKAETFEPKKMIGNPSEEELERLNAVLSHKMAVADKLYASYNELLGLDKLPPESEMEIGAILACVRDLDNTDIQWEDVYEEYQEVVDYNSNNKDLSAEHDRMLLQINLGSFEASCLSAAERILEATKSAGVFIVKNKK